MASASSYVLNNFAPRHVTYPPDNGNSPAPYKSPQRTPQCNVQRTPDGVLQVVSGRDQIQAAQHHTVLNSAAYETPHRLLGQERWAAITFSHSSNRPASPPCDVVVEDFDATTPSPSPNSSAASTVPPAASRVQVVRERAIASPTAAAANAAASHPSTSRQTDPSRRGCGAHQLQGNLLQSPSARPLPQAMAPPTAMSGGWIVPAANNSSASATTSPLQPFRAVTERATRSEGSSPAATPTTATLRQPQKAAAERLAEPNAAAGRKTQSFVAGAHLSNNRVVPSSGATGGPRPPTIFPGTTAPRNRLPPLVVQPNGMLDPVTPRGSAPPNTPTSAPLAAFPPVPGSAPELTLGPARGAALNAAIGTATTAPIGVAMAASAPPQPRPFLSTASPSASVENAQPSHASPMEPRPPSPPLVFTDLAKVIPVSSSRHNRGDTFRRQPTPRYTPARTSGTCCTSVCQRFAACLSRCWAELCS